MKTVLHCLVVVVLFLNSFEVKARDTSFETRFSTSQLAEMDKIAADTFNSAHKYVDEVFTETRFHARLATPNMQNIPITVVQGEFGGTLSTTEKMAIGYDMLKRNSKALLFTTKERSTEAAAFKQEFERKYPNVTLSVYELPERYIETYNKDVEANREHVLKQVYLRVKEGLSRPKQLAADFSNIMRAQITPATAAEKKSALQWGVVSAGLTSAVFFSFGTFQANIDFAISATVITALTTFLMEYNKSKIDNLVKAHMFRDFRVAPQSRRNFEKLVVVTAGSSFVGVSESGNSAQIEISPEAISSNLGTQGGQDYVENQIKKQLTNNLADRVTVYLKIMNGILSAMITAGAVGFKFDIGLLEVTQIQVVMMSANLGIGYVMSKIKDLETRIGSFDLRTATKRSFVRYKSKVMKSIRTLALQYEIERTSKNNRSRFPIFAETQYTETLERVPTSTLDLSRFKITLPTQNNSLSCRQFFTR